MKQVELGALESDTHSQTCLATETGAGLHKVISMHQGKQYPAKSKHTYTHLHTHIQNKSVVRQ